VLWTIYRRAIVDQASTAERPLALPPECEEICVTVYQFHQWRGEDFIEDPEGFTCVSLEAARERAIDGARDVPSGEAKNGCIDVQQRVELSDDAGRLRLTIPFSEAVEVIAPPAATPPMILWVYAAGALLLRAVVYDFTEARQRTPSRFVPLR
jgi:hypothetical protein